MQRRQLLQSALTLGALSTASVVATKAASEAPHRTTGSVTTRDGTQLFVQQWGSGRPVLFVHGWGLSSEIWAKQFVQLADAGLRCVAYDRRGHGRSDVPSGGYDMDSLADDLASVIDDLGLHDVMLVGHSMGCAEIARYIGGHGDGRITSVALLAPTTPFLLHTADNPYGALESAWDSMRAKISTDFPQWIEENKRPFFTSETSAAAMDWVARLMAATPLPAALCTHRAFTTFDFRPDLAKIARPTLVLHGDKDASAPLDITGRRTAAMIAGARLKIYPGAPHGLFLTHAKEVNADLLSFARS